MIGGKSNRSPFGGGLMARAGGGLNKAAPQMPNVPKAPGLAQASGVIEGVTDQYGVTRWQATQCRGSTSINSGSGSW